MKNTLYFLIILISLSSTKKIIAQTSDKYEKDLISIEKVITKILRDGSLLENNLDSLNQIKTQKLVQYIKSQKSIDYQYLENKDVFQLVESPDKQFILLCWDTYTGGTMHMYESICVYKLRNKTYVKILHNDSDDYKYYYSKIDQVKLNKKLYYLVRGTGRFSSGDFCSVIENYYIEKHGDIKSDKIFFTKNENLSSIEINYNYYKMEELPDEPTPFIKYNSKKGLLEIGVINELGKFANMYLKYFKKKNGFKYIKK